MNGNTTPGRSRKLRSHLVAGVTLLGGYLACTPDFSKLSSETGMGGRQDESGGETAGGSAGKGASGGGAMSGGRQSTGATAGTAETGGAGEGGQIEPELGGAAGGGGAPEGGAMTNGGEGSDSECNRGFTTCPGAPACRTQVSVGNADGATFTDCGACGTLCSLDNAESATCSNGRCVPACDSSHADCATDTNDGCETDVTTLENCGSCMHACSLAGASDTLCDSGICQPTCVGVFLDCTPDDGVAADDGCETFTDTLSNCGQSCSSSGTACAADEVCNAGACGAAQGLVKFTVPLTAAGQLQRFADKFPTLPNLANKSLIVRLYAPGATGGSINIYPYDQNSNGIDGVLVELSALATGWADVVVPIVAPTGGATSVRLSQLNFEIGTTSDAGPWTNPTLVYVDAVWSSDLVVNDRFDSDFGQMIPSTKLIIPNSTYEWVDSVE